MPTRKLLRAGIIILVLFCGLLLGLTFLFLPSLVEKTVVPALARRAGLSDFTFQVRSIRTTGADLSDLRWGQCRTTGFCADTVQLDYSPLGLYRKQIRRIRISGVRVGLALENGRLSLPGIDLSRLRTTLSNTPQSLENQGDMNPIPFIEQIEIRGASLLLTVEDRAIWIPLEIDLTPPKGESKDWRCSIAALFSGRPLKLSGRVDTVEKTGGFHRGPGPQPPAPAGPCSRGRCIVHHRPSGSGGPGRGRLEPL